MNENRLSKKLSELGFVLTEEMRGFKGNELGLRFEKVEGGPNYDSAYGKGSRKVDALEFHKRREEIVMESGIRDRFDEKIITTRLVLDVRTIEAIKEQCELLNWKI